MLQAQNSGPEDTDLKDSEFTKEIKDRVLMDDERIL